MDKIIILTINGEQFRFEDIGFSSEQLNQMQKCADSISFLQECEIENELCEDFILEVKRKLDIMLNPVKVSQVIRLKKNL